MPEPMTVARQQEFLSEGTRTAVLVTLRASGRPHAVPIWYALDGEDVVMFTGADSVKGKAMRANPQVSVVVDDDQPPYAFVSVEGTAELSDDPAELRRCATLIAERYLPAEQAAQFVEYSARAGNILVRVKANHVIAQDRVAG
ncbi:PPOX class F420-dependent oxidoreductase [Kutzneria sp. 744]|uniref:PPOX class F420-dependent oxidoreductase n=1 Tax=Kutzneria sp. (strain 744) TaxID=345341 RepID=UPI0003EEB23C|nr:PPOX class F420-dependent oxidoreductase [Kutzneria sp. 744]EWM16051.1 pyridoxamine 5prime-phosphate oxidase [Kutzneria sp. 744]